MCRNAMSDNSEPARTLIGQLRVPMDGSPVTLRSERIAADPDTGSGQLHRGGGCGRLIARSIRPRRGKAWLESVKPRGRVGAPCTSHFSILVPAASDAHTSARASAATAARRTGPAVTKRDDFRVCGHAGTAADIPCSFVSRGCLEMGPGGVFVVDGVGLEAAVEDADEAVAELA